MVLVIKNLPSNAGDSRDVDLIPELRRSPRGGHGNPLQYSCLENPTDRGTWRADSPWGHKQSDTAEHSTARALGERSKQTLSFICWFIFHCTSLRHGESFFSFSVLPSAQQIIIYVVNRQLERTTEEQITL